MIDNTLKYGTGEHTADLVLWVEAESREGIFRDAPLALAELMVEGSRQGRVLWRDIRLEAGDGVGLMVELLNEVVYLLEASNLLVARHEVKRLTETVLESRLGLIEPDPAVNAPDEPVKAVTYHQAVLEKTGPIWRMQVTLDV